MYIKLDLTHHASTEPKIVISGSLWIPVAFVQRPLGRLWKKGARQGKKAGMDGMFLSCDMTYLFCSTADPIPLLYFDLDAERAYLWEGAD